MAPLVDIGLNLTSKQFDRDRDAVVARALAANVRYMIVTGLSVALSEQALELARARPGALCCTVGVHPHNARTLDTGGIDRLRELLQSREAVAVGECGLDYNRDFSPRPQQREAFEAQLMLAAELRKPVFLHQRDAHDDFARILANARSRLFGGVVHCFTGDERELEAYLELGLCVGVTGWVCDERRGTGLQKLVKRIPAHRMMVETDAPYLMPRDLKVLNGKRNEPASLPHIARSVARFTEKDEATIVRETTATAFALFGLRALFGDAA